LTPAKVGLPTGSRRRTPGLRRAEVATLAGISVEYLTRLEQGRDTNPSVQVLAALAETLRLDEGDRDHLQQLAAIGQGVGLCARERRSPARAIRPTMRALLDHLDATPAYVINHLTDLLAWNHAFDQLARPLGMLDAEEPNVVWYTFTDERARTAYADWDDEALDQVSLLHAQRHGDPATDALAERLAAAAGPDFQHIWQDRPLSVRRTGVTGIDHPRVGLLRLAFERLEVADHDYQQLVVQLPADAATATGLDRLTGRTPGSLRSVAL
jgi:transcriptional regulator with XRE-family HTH domain